MMKELTSEDFEKAKPNPYFEKLMTKIEVAIRKDDMKIIEEVAKMNGVPADIIMRNCLSDYAKKFQEA